MELKIVDMKARQDITFHFLNRKLHNTGVTTMRTYASRHVLATAAAVVIIAQTYPRQQSVLRYQGQLVLLMPACVIRTTRSHKALVTLAT